MAALPKPDEGAAFSLSRIRPIDTDRCVIGVSVGPVSIVSVWITGMASGRVDVSWPQSGKGYPIVSVAEPLKSQIERAIRAEIDRARKDGL